MNRGALAVSLILLAQTLSAGEWVVGAEGDNRHTYTYISRIQRRPVRRGQELVFAGTVSYLRYESGGLTVSSPGLGGSAEYRFFGPRYSFGAGAGYEVRYTDRRIAGASDSKIDHGPIALTDASFRIAQQTWISATGGYSVANEWLAGNVQLKQGLSPGLRVGAESGWQGNDDIRVRTQGGLVEVPAGSERSWLQFRAGTATIRDRNGNEERRPYYSFGIARSF
ncbi:MAG TPA: hypothetical protein VKL19_03810 [Thermoanaerobaculia bacterium]|nr:hypothetical protein [Thermoanaerobaculia bacterium]